MRNVLVFAAAVVGGTMLAFGNVLGVIAIIPAIVVTLKTA
jgi:hypothetical protein